MRTEAMNQDGLTELRALLEHCLRSVQCPPPEIFVHQEELPATQRQDLNAHVANCPACAAERVLAQAFRDEPEGVSGEDRDWLIGQMTQATAAMLPAKDPGDDPGDYDTAMPAEGAAGARRWQPRWIALAASVAMVAVLLSQLMSRPPALPNGPETSVMRTAAQLSPVPTGELSAWPAQLRWEEIPEATHYAVTMLRVDNTVLWNGDVEHNNLALLSLVEQEILQTHVRYYLHIDALDASGEVLASSRTNFRVRPGSNP